MSRRSKQLDAAFQQGERLHAAGRLNEAEQIYREILAAEPRHADTNHMLGVLVLQSAHPAAALDLFDGAIALKPLVSSYHVHRAHALLALGRPADAVAACRIALRTKSNNAEAYQALGHAHSDALQPGEALRAYREAVRLKPDLLDLFNNLGTALRNIGALEEAGQRLREAMRRAPNDLGVQLNLSSVLKELGKTDDAEALLRDALCRQPGNPVFLYNLSLLLLLTGRDAEAWPGWEQRFAARAIPNRGLPQPQWNGEPLNGRTLLIYAEQGLGDTIQFCRFLPALGGKLLFEAPPRLRRLLSTLPGAPPMIVPGETVAADLVCPLMSIPARTGVAMPADVPYLSAEPDRVLRWRKRIGTAGLKIGIAWQGNPARTEDRGRSIQLREFAPLAAVAGVRLIGLQKNDGTQQLQDAPAVETLGPDFDAGPDGFLDTAAAMMCLDIVITSDTAIAHLAGALGRPVWVALRKVPDWRWQLGREDSPWYPTMRLFRQTERDDWGPVFAAMAEAVGAMTDNAETPPPLEGGGRGEG
jgi:tetratricopeptide (TPR) repeat protein